MTTSYTTRLTQLEADIIMVKGQVETAERDVIRPLLARVIELGEQITRIRDEERQARDNRGLYGRLASVATLQLEFPEINIRSLVKHSTTNGIESALVRPHGRGHNHRVLIDRQRFNEWLEAKRGGPTATTSPPSGPVRLASETR